ncbi:hypothetical protein BD769DRAFT_1674606 [Suillus cothurnatus]|nr:hypothetical protein BD769DRAFT_1674606 [Suillus cothurnatus]
MLDEIWSGGTWVAWGRDKKEAPVHLCVPPARLEPEPPTTPSKNHIEIKCMDSTSYPYLVLSSILGSGLLGIQSKTLFVEQDCTTAAALMTEAERDIVRYVAFKNRTCQRVRVFGGRTWFECEPDLPSHFVPSVSHRQVRPLVSSRTLLYPEVVVGRHLITPPQPQFDTESPGLRARYGDDPSRTAYHKYEIGVSSDLDPAEVSVTIPLTCHDRSFNNRYFISIPSSTFNSPLRHGPDTAGKDILFKADPIADTLRTEVKDALAVPHCTPTLVGILATDASPSRFYTESTRKQCEGLEVKFILKEVEGTVKQNEGEGEAKLDGDGVEELIIEANEDVNFDGIMVYYPIFGGQQDHYLQQIVSPLKDVEGLNSKFHYNPYHNIRFITPASLTSIIPSTKIAQPIIDDIPPPGTVKSIIPCTPLGVSSISECITRSSHTEIAHIITIQMFMHYEVKPRQCRLLDKSFSPLDTLSKLRAQKFTLSASIYILHLLSALFWLTLMQVPPFPYKLAIPVLYAIALLIPFTSQFFVPATPVFSCHFPIVPAALLWLFRPPTPRIFAKAFGYQNCIGVFTQIIHLGAAPWYEIIYGLTLAAYSTPGSAGGLARIDELFGGEGYKRTFASSLLIFGAFPSLYAAWATLKALFINSGLYFGSGGRYEHGYGCEYPNEYPEDQWIGQHCTREKEGNLAVVTASDDDVCYMR